jgi:hypothetical protein
MLTHAADTGLFSFVVVHRLKISSPTVYADLRFQKSLVGKGAEKFMRMKMLEWICYVLYPSAEDKLFLRALRNALMKVAPTYLKGTRVSVFYTSEVKVENTDIERASVILIG